MLSFGKTMESFLFQVKSLYENDNKYQKMIIKYKSANSYSMINIQKIY